jgi:hypothetical protein
MQQRALHAQFVQHVLETALSPVLQHVLSQAAAAVHSRMPECKTTRGMQHLASLKPCYYYEWLQAASKEKACMMRQAHCV